MYQHVKGPINSKAVIAYCHRDKTFSNALQLAKKLLSGQKRAFTGFDYLSHPLTVASLLIEVKAPQPVMVAAALQDSLSRTTLKAATLEKEYGAEVAAMVRALTPVKNAEGQVDLAAYKAQLEQGGESVQTIKLASLLDHLAPLSEKYAKKAGELIAEATELLPSLTQGHPELMHRAQAALRRARQASL